MLLITRRAGERIVVGDEITIEVVEVSGSQVRLGVRAPRSVSIYREEILEAVTAENRAAAAASPDALARVKKPRR